MRSSWNQAAARARDLAPAVAHAVLAALVLAAVLALAVALVPAGEAAPATGATPAADSLAADSLAFVIEIGNRMYPEWKEERRVGLRQPFVIGDTENVGVVTRFLPSFLLVDGEPISVSTQLDNPAIRLLVYADDAAPVDSSWAFLNFPPHFAPHNFFTFQLKKVEGYREPAAAAAKGE